MKVYHLSYMVAPKELCIILQMNRNSQQDICQEDGKDPIVRWVFFRMGHKDIAQDRKELQSNELS